MTSKHEPPVETAEEYERNKVLGIVRIGKPYDGKATELTDRDSKPLFPEKLRREDDDVLPPLKPRDWTQPQKT